MGPCASNQREEEKKRQMQSSVNIHVTESAYDHGPSIGGSSGQANSLAIPNKNTNSGGSTGPQAHHSSNAVPA